MFETLKNEALEAKIALMNLKADITADEKVEIEKRFVEKTTAREDSITNSETVNDITQVEELNTSKADFVEFQKDYTTEMRTVLNNTKIEVAEATEDNTTELGKLGSEITTDKREHIDNIQEIILTLGAKPTNSGEDKSKKSISSPELKAGIKTLQNYLNETYHTNLIVDGIVGKKTTTALLAQISPNNSTNRLDKMLAEKPTFTKIFNVPQSVSLEEKTIKKTAEKDKDKKEKISDQKVNIITNTIKKLYPNSIKQKDDDFLKAWSIALIEKGYIHSYFIYHNEKYWFNGTEYIPRAKKKKNTSAQNQQNILTPSEQKNTNKSEKIKKESYKNWEDIKRETIELNKLSNTEKIITYKKKKGSRPYAIIDKQKGILYIHDQKSGKVLFSGSIDLGANKGDAQTVTKIKDKNGDGIISRQEAQKGQADFSKGNKSTGAGRFYISHIDSKGYGGLPLLNMMNEQQYENYKQTNQIDNVATSLHKGYIKDNTNRLSNGCIRCDKETLHNLVKYLNSEDEIYILPEDEGNNFVYENGKLNFKVNSGKDYNEYSDKHNTKQKGQGINRSINTLHYIPIKVIIDEAKFKNDKFTSFDFDDEQEYKNVQAFIKALENNKKDIMKIAKINGDVYNEIAKITFGIFGTESNFADTHSPDGNLIRATKKWSSPSSSSSPDYYSKYYQYGAKEGYRSVGMTQMRWNYLNEDEKKALAQVNIKSNKAFMSPTTAALGTAIILGIRYNQQLTGEQKKNIWKYLPTKWNVRKNYADRVKKNSQYLSIQQAAE